MKTFEDVFAAFEGPARLAAEIGIQDFHAQTMKTRGNIPAGYFLRVAAAAERLGLKDITVETLAAIAETKVEKARAKKADPAPEPVRVES